jgi:hypothetical protein
MCNFVKDDGEQCGRETEPFCHQHEDTRFAVLWHRTEDAETTREPFECEWAPTHCDECESAVRVVCARIDEAAFQPKSVIPTLALTCRCGNSVQYMEKLPKSDVPEKWLFEADR